MSQRHPDVLCVCHRWPPPTFLQFTLEALARRGVAITVVAPLPMSDPPVLRGVEYVPLPGVSQPARELLPGLVRDLAVLAATDRRRLRAAVSAYRRDLRRRPGGEPRGRVRTLRSFLELARLHPRAVHFQAEDIAAHHVEIMRLWDRPVITSCRAQVNMGPPGTAVAEYVPSRLAEVLERSDAVHAVSRPLARAAMDSGADPDRTTLIAPALEPGFFRPSRGPRHPGGELRILTVGWLRWLKGYEYALEAIRRLVDRGVAARLDVLGDSPPPELERLSDHERFLHTVDDLGLHDRVHLHGRVATSEVRERMACSDVLLHASLTEGVPNVVIEAMASGLAVVTTDCGGVREAVRDGVDGLVVPVRDAGVLARALERLARDPALRRRMGEAARSRVESHFTLDAQVERFLGLYASVGVTARA